MKNKRMLIIPPIVFYIIWLILIPIIFRGQTWIWIQNDPAIPFLYFMSTLGLALGIAAIYVIGNILVYIIATLNCWIMDGKQPKKKSPIDPLLKEAEKEVEEFLRKE